MRKKVNLLLAGLVLGLLGTAYAACFLNQVVLCAGSGDSIGGGTTSCSTATGTQSFVVRAYENAYKWDIYSVTRGGFYSKTEQTYCATYAPSPTTSGGFMVSWVNPCNGTTLWGYNLPSGGSFSFTFSENIIDTSYANCN